MNIITVQNINVDFAAMFENNEGSYFCYSNSVLRLFTLNVAWNYIHDFSHTVPPLASLEVS